MFNRLGCLLLFSTIHKVGDHIASIYNYIFLQDSCNSEDSKRETPSGGARVGLNNFFAL